MKLEIKHITPYLPYKLNYFIDFEDGDTAVYEMIGIFSDSGEIYLDGYETNLDSETCKPILRPLSDLTKMIDCKGKKFVPIQEIVNSFYEGGIDSKVEGDICKWETFAGENGDFVDQHTFQIVEMRYESEGNKLFKSESSTDNQFALPKSNSFLLLDYDTFFDLCSWHFDVFGLIPSGLAIDINTIK